LGRRRASFYSKDLDRRIREKLRIESKLKKALDNGVLDIFLQPQYSSKNMGVVWAEALVRWDDDAEGYIAPEKFIPIAEESGLIQRVGHYVLERVCYDLREHKQYLSLMGIEGISVNLSAPQLYSKNLVADIRHVINEFNVDSSSIEFEITESMLMNDIDKAITVMKGLRDLGCRISIDDFGTGYSSLSYLSRFPINSVKIDRSFVSRIPDYSNDIEIASAIIAMSHKLGLSVVAEGVETEEQKDFLIEQGCEVLQGFYLARPENINHFVTLGRQRSLRLVKKD
jgi:EAL domain-containing protein (putative c-di-GMP-specific phosphodiesterase class I)